MDFRLFGALFGFLLGAAGYVIFRYWYKPIRLYRKLEKQVLEDLSVFSDVFSSKTLVNPISKARLKESRKQISKLNDCFFYEIPSWYRLLLKSRGIFPDEAVKHILSLSQIKDSDHAMQRVHLARVALKGDKHSTKHVSGAGS